MNELNFQGPPSKIVKWNVKENQFLQLGHTLFNYVVIETAKENKEKSAQSGLIKEILAQNGEIIENGTTLLILQDCPHPTVMRDMCAECGKDLRKLDEITQTAKVSMIHSLPDLRVSREVAMKIGKIDEERLLSQNKLVLLVDLDQTLIHTTNDQVPVDIEDVLHFQLHHQNVWYHTRLRPLTKQFLQNVQKLFELHICTFGTRNYAHVIAKFLDPDGKLFSDRILSRDECLSLNSKTANLKELFPRGDQLVCIIDDREDVWNYAPNLVHVKPYCFFRNTGDIHAPEGFSKLSQFKEQFKETKDPDDHLLYLTNILTTIHSAFYALKRETQQIPDIKNVIPYVRKKVLKNVSIVFSGVLPTSTTIEERNRSKPYITAVSLGAVVTELFVSETTHLVANRLGTVKVNEAKKYKNVSIVTPEWLWCCSERWERVNEALFGLDKFDKLKRERSGGRFKDSINPLLSFSLDEIEMMGHEVDDMINESESESESEEGVFKKSNSSNSDSSSSDSSKPMKKKKKEDEESEKIGEPEPEPDLDQNNSSSSENENDSESNEKESWMATELERQFMDEESNN